MIQPKFHSDDVGLSPAIDKKIFSSIKDGKIGEVSVMADFITPQNAKILALLAKKDKSLQVALHVDFVEGKNMFHFIWGVLCGKITGETLNKEIVRQVTVLKKYNLPIHSLDSHRHTHALSPIAEIIKSVASEYHIPHIRSYYSINTYTFTAKIKYLFLKTVSAISYLLAYKKWGMPYSWTIPDKDALILMSWESNGWDIRHVSQTGKTYLIHPYLSFDSNLSYTRYL